MNDGRNLQLSALARFERLTNSQISTIHYCPFCFCFTVFLFSLLFSSFFLLKTVYSLLERGVWIDNYVAYYLTICINIWVKKRGRVICIEKSIVLSKDFQQLSTKWFLLRNVIDNGWVFLCVLGFPFVNDSYINYSLFSQDIWAEVGIVLEENSISMSESWALE